MAAPNGFVKGINRVNPYHPSEPKKTSGFLTSLSEITVFTRNLLDWTKDSFGSIFLAPLLILDGIASNFVLFVEKIFLLVFLTWSKILLVVLKTVHPEEQALISTVNNHDMFSGNEEIIHSAKNALAERHDNEVQIPRSPLGRLEISPAEFNLEVAIFLLLCSALMYEIDSDLLNQAISKENEFQSNQNDQVENQIRDLLDEAQKFIQQKASTEWDVKFTGLTTLNLEGGMVAGLYKSTNPPFIVVAFKGTTPTQFSDILIDSRIDRTDASAFLHGECHEGFYSALFPSVSPRDAPPRSQESPYHSIIKELRKELKKMYTTYQHPINVWVTGHSLGAAISCLFFSRLVKCPKDLGDYGVLMDYYGFGCPATGDIDFASGHLSAANMNYDPDNPTRQRMFRIIHDKDIVPRVPPGLGDLHEAASFLSRSSTLAWAHIGEGIIIYDDNRSPELEHAPFALGKQVVVVSKNDDNEPEPLFRVPRSKSHYNRLITAPSLLYRYAKSKKHRRNALGANEEQSIFFRLLPQGFVDHTTSGYYHALRHYYERRNKKKNKMH